MEPGLLRFATVGSIDDGKSTLIGRLLSDSDAVYEDQLEAVRKASRDGLDLAFITDGLRAEREQGITIDVAYRYFSTPRRKFVIVDTPGHEQYTRNMVTGASLADLVVILVDARKGVLPQTRRHSYIAWLLGIRHILVTVNKMDLVDYRREAFDRIREEFQCFAASIPGCDPHFIPVSALQGDNIVRSSSRMPWFAGDSLLEHLETVPLGDIASTGPFRFPVQYAIRARDHRSYAGPIASGSIEPGNKVIALPSGQTTHVRSISTFDGDLARASAPLSVALCLEDYLDVGRGSLLADPDHPPLPARRLRATLVWMSEAPLALHHPYLVKHTSQRVCAEIQNLVSVLDLVTLQEVPAADMRMNDIGTVELETHRPLFCDLYSQNRTTGSFILIDPMTNQTLAAGMIQSAHVPHQPGRQTHQTAKTGWTVWFTGLSSSGKTTLSRAVYERLWAMGRKVELLDGDEVRRHLSKDLGFSRADRDENIRRIGFVAELLTRNGVIALVSAISPYRAIRDEVRGRIGNFVEVFVNAPLEVCEQRDLKGLYKKARAGLLTGFTGIDAPYEAPLNPEVECRTDREDLAASVDRVLRYLETLWP